ncbi:MAG TPA: hypothetical protein VFK88_07255 [Gallionella sp.]|nr:hypothetical protein [Gallionella sp.]
MTTQNSIDDTEEALALEVRADQLPLDVIEANTSIDGPARTIVSNLLTHGAKLLVGPRGCGKTHLMRFAWVQSVNDVAQPFAIYLSFNKYLRLEPLLRSKSNALDLFHGWILCLCYLGLHEAIEAHLKRDTEIAEEDLWLEYPQEDLQVIVARLERGGALLHEHQEIFDSMSLVMLKQAIERIARALNRNRSVVLMDDAALTLAPEYLPDFFDLFRALKAPTISPKASVYPGTTEYGPRFHVAHEAEEVQAWISVEHAAYSELMESIGTKRMANYASVPSDIREVFKYVAFGIPRAYLLLLHEYVKAAEQGTPQSRFNTIIEKFVKNKEAEYLSLIQKVPKFTTLIKTGLDLFNKMCAALVDENMTSNPAGEKQLYVGVQEHSSRNLYVERMFSLLIEAGLLYGFASSVSHGKERVYERFIPHLGALIKDRAFSEGRGFSPAKVVENIRLPNAKHPLRRSVSTLLGQDAIGNLKLDLPPCQNCQTPRISDSAKHCHNCGAKLTDPSAFASCMNIELASIPNLTAWQQMKLSTEFTDIKTVGDFMALRDPGTELRRIHQVGKARATRINQSIEAFVDEFLS